VLADREAAFAELSGDTQQTRLLEAWDRAFVPPTDPTNSTGLWLLPHELSTDVYSTTRVFEHFGDLIGAPVSNPARKLDGKLVSNPAVDLATERGIDLIADLARISQTAEGSPEFLSVEQKIIDLIPDYRKRTGASEAITDQDLICAICEYDKPVMIEPALKDLSESEQLQMMRSILAPHISECCTDGDILAAVRNSNQPLVASGLCRVQTLYRDLWLPVDKALTFSSEQLRRERLSAELWHAGWTSQTDRNPPVVELTALAA